MPCKKMFVYSSITADGVLEHKKYNERPTLGKIALTLYWSHFWEGLYKK